MSEAAFQTLDNLGLTEDKRERLYIDSPLTEEEKEALLNQPDKGITPVPMREFRTLDEFKDGGNNFHVTFTYQHPENMFGAIKRTQKSFQRLEILKPELVKRLMDKFATTSDIDAQAWEDMYEAYKEMSKLVDVNDRGVAEKGEHANNYLCA